MPFREIRRRYVPGGRFHPGGTQPYEGAATGRYCFLGGLASVTPLPASTSRADERSLGEEIERRATPTAAPLRCSPADIMKQAERTDARTSSQISRHSSGLAVVIFPAELTTREDRTRRGPNICTKCHFRIVASVIFPAGATMHAEKIPTTADKLGRVPRWRRGLG